MGSPPPIARASAVAAALIALSATPAVAAGASEPAAGRALRTLGSVSGFTPAPALAADGRAAVVVSDYAPGRSRILAFTRSRGRWAAAPRVLRTSRQEIFEPVAAFTGDGTGVFAWIRAPRLDQEQLVEGKRLLVSGELTPLARISPGRARAIFPRVAGGPGGRALVAWSDDDYALLATEVAGGFVPPVSIIDGPQFDYELAYLPDGTAVVVSQAFGSGGVQVRMKPPGGGWTEPVILSGRRTAREAALAVGTDGTVAVAWAQAGEPGYRIQVSVRRPGGEFTAAQTLAPQGGEARAPGLAVRGDGSVVVAWLGGAALGFLPRGQEIRLATITSGGGTSAARRVSAAGRRIGAAPTVLADAEGDVLVAWEESRRLMAATRTSAGRLAAPQLLSPAAGRILAPRVVGNARGEALASWALETGRAGVAVIQASSVRF